MARIGVIVSEELKQELKNIADREERDLSFIVRKALENYVEIKNTKSEE